MQEKSCTFDEHTTRSDSAAYIAQPPASAGQSYPYKTNHQRGLPKSMLLTLFVVLLLLWLIGLFSSITIGGFIHVLLVLALLALIFEWVTGAPTLPILRRRGA
jgi:hypothetical protein